MCVTAAAVVEFPTRQNSLCWSLDEDDFRDGRSHPSKTLTTTSVLAGGLHIPPRTALWNHIELIFIFALFSLTFFSCCVDFTQGTSENIKLFRYTSFFLFSNYLLCFHVYTLFGRFFSLNSCIGPWYKPISRRRREHSFFLHPKGKKNHSAFFSVNHDKHRRETSSHWGTFHFFGKEPQLVSLNPNDKLSQNSKFFPLKQALHTEWFPLFQAALPAYHRTLSKLPRKIQTKTGLFPAP